MTRYFLISALLLFICNFVVSTEAQKGRVSWDERAILLNGKRELILAGSIHYPRSTPEMWPHLFQLTKEAGLNAVDTYVFWNDHEPERGVYDFNGNKNLRLFMEMAHEAGLYVVLRLGPYVCAEWNYGGFPAWLREIPGVDFRTWNEPFKQEMSRFLRNMISYVEDLFYQNGGPIILLQVENEYGLVEGDYGQDGYQYIQWAAQEALSLNTSLPWIMCVQDNVPSLINTCNGFYCDSWIAHSRNYPKQPGMWTENWTGWFSIWGDVLPLRPTEDLAFAVALWFANGGTYNAYYMWHGGTNFARTAGVGITTSYDYDAPLDEYGFKAEPKYSHLKTLHLILRQFSDLLLDYKVKRVPLGNEMNAFIFGDFRNSAEHSLVFLINEASSGADRNVQFMGHNYRLPRWSATLIKGPASRPSVLYCTAKNLPEITSPIYKPVKESIYFENDPVVLRTIESTREPIGVWNRDASRIHTVPLEQIAMTRDKTDYLWYVLDNIKLPPGTTSVNVTLTEANDYVNIFWNNVLVASARGGNSSSFMFEISEQTGDEIHKLQILSQTAGLTNFGAHRQLWARGIRGPVYLNNADVTERGWTHQVGLLGEHDEYFVPGSDAPFRKHQRSEPPSPMTWYRINFPAIDPSRNNVDTAYALDLGSMGKGQVWMNGHHLGRYWNVTGKLPDVPSSPYPHPAPAPVPSKENNEELPPCDYAGPFFADKCRTGSKPGQITQRYYHVPREWLQFSGAGGENNIVIFEEIGGNIEEVKLVSVKRGERRESPALMKQQ